MRRFTKLMLSAAVVISLVCALTVSALAYTGTLRIPPEGVTQTVTLTDGSKLVGKTTMITADKIEFQTELGLMSIALDKIAEVSETKVVVEVKPAEEPKPVEEVKAVETPKEEPKVAAAQAGQSKHPDWFPNPNRTRLLIAPNARPMKARSGYFFDLWVFFPASLTASPTTSRFQRARRSSQTSTTSYTT